MNIYHANVMRSHDDDILKLSLGPVGSLIYFNLSPYSPPVIRGIVVSGLAQNSILDFESEVEQFNSWVCFISEYTSHK